MKKLFCIILCLALLAALCACGAKPAQDEATSQSVPEDAGQSEPAPTPEPEPEPEPQSSDDSSSGEAPMPDVFDVPAEDGSVYVKDGLKLVVPNEYANLVLIGQGSPLFGRDDLFSAREIASMEAGEKQHPGEDWGDGALFGIGRLSESEVHEMMCGYLNNEHIFAKDAENNYYVCFQPTDVRFVREDMSNLHDSPDLAQWTALNEWADTVPDSFTELNGLERVYYGGTDAEMMLSRIAYHTDTFFMLNSLDYGELYPDTPERSAEFARKLLDGVRYEYCETTETPDGEYYVIDFPNDNLRLDFFKSADYVRADYGDYQMLMRITAPSEGYCTDVLSQWCQALQKAGG